MINTGTASFRVRSFGRFRLTHTGLEYLGKADELDNEELSREMLEEFFNRLNTSVHSTVHGAVELVHFAFEVDPSAVSDVKLLDSPTPPDLGDIEE
jgi:hypothetical protein